MKNRSWCWCLLIGLALCLAAATCLASGKDTQLWPAIYTTTELNNRFDFVANGQLRFGNDITELIRESVQVGFNYRLLPFLVVSPTYEYLNNDPADGSHSTENRASFLATVHFPIHEFRIAIGNDLEYRDPSSRSNSWRYRPKLTLEHPLGPRSWDLMAYLADEGFYDSEYDKWVSNRFYAGFKKKLIQTLTLDLYYLRQDDSEATPGTLNVIGIALRFNFNTTGGAYSPAHAVD